MADARMEAANMVLGRLLDGLLKEIGRQMGYLFRYKDNITELNRKIDDLKGAKGRMEGQIDKARRKGDNIEGDVQAWITSVEKITSEVQTFIQAEEVVLHKAACFHLRSRLRPSKEATRKISTVVELQQKANDFKTVGRAAPPIGINPSKTVNIDAYHSQKSAMIKAMDALMDENIHTVAICGTGGVGKTTLAMELGRRVKADNKFTKVVMAVVSRKESKEIQNIIAGKLDMKELPENDELRRGRLWDRISKCSNVLLILDDVWDKLDLVTLGIPVRRDKNSFGCKVVLTSRDEFVCGRMGAQRVVPVTPMPEEEAWMLFKEVVHEVSEADLRIDQIEGKIFNECRRLPVAIVAVGETLRNEDKKNWDLVYHNLKDVSPADNVLISDVYPVLKTSYEYLKDEKAKSCFLLCSLFQEDADIPLEKLATYGIGLGIFQPSDGSLEHARLATRAAVNRLKHSFLLLHGKDDYHVKCMITLG